MKNNINTPILLIGFNRPDIIKESFKYIRAAQPKKLYVAIDGHRKDVEREEELVKEVKRIVNVVDWDCETKYKFNEKNLGAEVTVSSAVSWVLEHEESVIVLEDDIIAPLSFLNFAQDMLAKYAKNKNVYMISSCQFTPIDMTNNEDYLFGLYGHTWGWATWRRAWNRFDLFVNDFDEYLQGDKLDFLVNSKSEKKYWLNRIKHLKENGAGNNTWDKCWTYIRFKERGFSIIPKINLSSNIGILGLHAQGQTQSHYRSFDKNFTVEIHPNNIERSVEYDHYHFKTYLNRKTSLIVRVYNKVLRLLRLC